MEQPRQYEIHHHALGGQGRVARREYGGLILYVLALAAFCYWLVVYGVNV